MSKNYKNKNSTIIIPMKIKTEAEDTIKQLKEINTLLKDIKQIGIDLGQAKDYTSIRKYDDGKLIEEKIIQYK